MSPDPTLFAAMLIVSLGLFCYGCYLRLCLIALGQPDYRLDRLDLRLGKMLLFGLGQRKVVKEAAGLNHLVIFWSFLVLLLANAEFVLHGLFPALSLSLLPLLLQHVLLFLFDVVSLLTLVCVLFAAGRRLFFPPPSMSSDYVKARSAEGFVILFLIGLLMLAYFGLHGAEIAMGKETAAMPVSSLVAASLSAIPRQTLHEVAACSWWLHACALLGFLVYLPASKHMHIMTALPNCFLASLEPPNAQPREEFARGNTYGVERVDQLSWKDLLDSFSCTECGRCQAACPATATGKSLNPRQLIHAIKVNLLANGQSLRAGKDPQLPLIGEEREGTSTQETIWACTTCGACMNVCPVMIEHMPKIIKLRRHLVQMKASFPEELVTLFENLEARSNPWGIAPSERGKWQKNADAAPFVKGESEYLLYVGCAGSFDSRQKQVTVALASILDAAQLSWGTLGKDEKCCGDTLRRLGNEFVFDQMVRDNLAMFSEMGVKKIITQCPHCFSTFKNDYRQYGADFEVVHHSELIAQLLADGKLKLKSGGAAPGRLLFHDSCYLGRHNQIYSPPREALAAVTGEPPVEFRRHGNSSFCCGAGGGRMWQEEQQGERINLNRVKEALELGAESICVSCPYCMTMMEDGLKDLQKADVKVRDLAEIVADRLA
jgi:Fe-S oxidoreductase